MPQLPQKPFLTAEFWATVVVSVAGLGIPALIAFGKIDDRQVNQEKRTDVLERRVDDMANRVDQKLQHISDKLDDLRDRLPAKGSK